MTLNTFAWTLLALMLTSPLFLILWLVTRNRLVKARNESADLRTRLEPILCIEAEVNDLRKERSAVEREIGTVRATYREKRAFLDRLSEQVAIYDERLAFAELGVYEPHFDFTDSEDYKDAINVCR